MALPLVWQIWPMSIKLGQAACLRGDETVAWTGSSIPGGRRVASGLPGEESPNSVGRDAA